MYDCIIKTAFDKDNNVQWQGLYLDGKKVLENFEIDMEVALPIFAPDAKFIHAVNVMEDDFSSISSSFPNEEDFSYLLDYRDIKVGEYVWLEDGIHEVVEIKSGYRPAGEYVVTEWYGHVPVPVKTTFSGHEVISFKVKGNTSEYIWEDYNYQQSNLYEANKHKIVKTKKRA
jgi:hypothetical protein